MRMNLAIFDPCSLESIKHCDNKKVVAPSPLHKEPIFWLRMYMCRMIISQLDTFGVVMDNEHRGGYRWFLRVREHHFRGLFR